MSGRELDPDGTDSYHPQHPWEQTAHELYLPPSERTRENWPPEPAQPAGAFEEIQWRALPETPVQRRRERPMFGPGHTYPPKRAPRGPAGDSGARRPILCALGLHTYPAHVTAHTQAPAPVRCERCGRAY